MKLLASGEKINMFIIFFAQSSVLSCEHLSAPSKWSDDASNWKQSVEVSLWVNKIRAREEPKKIICLTIWRVLLLRGGGRGLKLAQCTRNAEVKMLIWLRVTGGHKIYIFFRLFVFVFLRQSWAKRFLINYNLNFCVSQFIFIRCVCCTFFSTTVHS